jgi:preprotein translocase subunit SecA
MLDNTSSSDQMLREVKRVSKAVSNFMKIVEEPDLQKAMQRMGMKDDEAIESGLVTRQIGPVHKQQHHADARDENCGQ